MHEFTASRRSLAKGTYPRQPPAQALGCSRIRRGRRSSGPTNRCWRCRAPVASTSSIRRRRHRNRRRTARRTTDAHARAHDGADGHDDGDDDGRDDDGGGDGARDDGDGGGDDAAPAARALQRAETTGRAALKTPASRTRPLRWQRLPMAKWKLAKHPREARGRQTVLLWRSAAPHHSP